MPKRKGLGSEARGRWASESRPVCLVLRVPGQPGIHICLEITRKEKKKKTRKFPPKYRWLHDGEWVLTNTLNVGLVSSGICLTGFSGSGIDVNPTLQILKCGQETLKFKAIFIVCSAICLFHSIFSEVCGGWSFPRVSLYVLISSFSQVMEYVLACSVF